MDKAATGTTAEQKAHRRRALTEFELRRDPGASDQVIAKRARCTTASVRPVRTALLEQGTLNPGATETGPAKGGSAAQDR